MTALDFFIGTNEAKGAKFFENKHVFGACGQCCTALNCARDCTVEGHCTLQSNINAINQESYAVAIQVFDHFYFNFRALRM